MGLGMWNHPYEDRAINSYRFKHRPYQVAGWEEAFRLESVPDAVFGPAMRRFHHEQFSNAGALVDAKQGRRISVCIPTLNEEETIGGIVATVRRDLMDAIPLVDEILVIDSGSTDATLRRAAESGARVHRSSEISPEAGDLPGKGENLWKALLVAEGDILCYLDADISNFHAGFVTGLTGPILTEPDVDYVKAFYERPISHGGGIESQGGGRVSEILVRPLISMFHPELTEVLQPLAGEYAARREVLESLPFPTGYGVEIAHLVDLAARGQIDRIAQTDLVKRVHRNRSEGDLGDTAFAILRVMLRRLERDGRISLHQALPEVHRRWLIDAASVAAVERHIPEPERPPLLEFLDAVQAGRWNESTHERF